MQGDAAMAVGSPAAEVAAMAAALRSLPVEVSDADRIDAIRQLEELRGAVAAAQARLTAEFVVSQRREQVARGVPSSRLGRGIASQIGLARRMSPWAAQRYAGWATIVTTELPATFAELSAGRTSEWRATLVARETAWLSREDRARVDAELAPQLERLGDVRTETAARQAAIALDQAGYVNRLSNVDEDRHVSTRPAPDMMGRVSALLPVAQCVAVRKALCDAADAARAGGDVRRRGQVMADTLVARCTGQETADAVAIEVQLIMDADDLLGNAGAEARADARADARAEARDADREEERRRGRAAWIQGFGPIPPAIARRLIMDRPNSAPTWLRRLFITPSTGELVAMESRRRTFTAGQRRFVEARDQVCRTPWCEAPIRHIDHIDPADHHGPTSIGNAAGLCEACNYAKQALDWLTRVAGNGDRDGTGGDYIIRTPTGHLYRSGRCDFIAPAFRFTIGPGMFGYAA